MQNTLSILGRLQDIFFLQALKENLSYNHGRGISQIETIEYFERKMRCSKEEYDEGLSKITQLMIMYDKLSFPTVFFPYVFSKELKEKVINETKIKPLYGFDNTVTHINEFSFDDAKRLKPIILNAIGNLKYSKKFIEFCDDEAGSVMSFYSGLYDYIYTDDSINYDNPSDVISEFKAYNLSKNQQFIDLASCKLKRLVKEMLLLRDISINDHFDIYSEIFNDFHTSWNKEDAYLILKTQISNVITLQPHFESIKEIIKFRKSKKREIKDYREQIANLENILKTDCRENAIKVAINNVKSANEALIKNTACKTAARLATYLSVPTSIIELLTFNTSFSILIGIVGAFAQIGADLSDKKNKWIFVAR